MKPPFPLLTSLLLVWATLQCTSAVKADNEPFFEFSSGVEAYDGAYKLAMTEMSQNIQNGTFIAGAGWDQLWTRDTSYAVELAAGLVHPEISKKSLEKSIQVDEKSGEQVWLQVRAGIINSLSIPH